MLRKLIRSKANFILNTSIEMYMLSIGETRYVQFLNETQAHTFFQLGQIEDLSPPEEEDHEEHHEEHHEDCHNESEDDEYCETHHFLSGHGRYRVRYVPEYGCLLVIKRRHHHCED